MNIPALLVELYGRIPPLAEQAVDGVDVDTLTRPPSPGANTIAWLVWHVARVQDHHVAELIGADQLWTEGAWPASSASTPIRPTTATDIRQRTYSPSVRSVPMHSRTTSAR